MSTLATRQPTVIVDSKAKTDAALVQRAGQTFLVLQPVQTFTNAVMQISQLMPSMHPDEVRRLVRLHMPTAADFDSVESSLRNVQASRLAPGFTLPPLTRRERRQSLVRRLMIKSVLGSILTLSLVAYFVVDGLEPEPYETAAFKKFAQVGNMMCDPIDATHARCTDVDGMVMLSTVVTSPEYTVFSFSYGAEKLSMRVYPTAEAAQVAIREPANREMYLNITQAGRYLFYGTDEDRLAVYADMVRKATPNPRAAGARVVESLPVRVGGLAFGALSLPEQDRIELVSATQEQAVRALLGESPKPVKHAPGPVVVVSAAGEAVADRARVETLQQVMKAQAVEAAEALKAVVPVPSVTPKPSTPKPAKTPPKSPPAVQLPPLLPVPAVTTLVPTPPSSVTPPPVVSSPEPSPAAPESSETTPAPGQPAAPAEGVVDAVETAIETLL